MPQIFRFGEYWIYFWTNESQPLEPVHIHVSKGAPTANATKNPGTIPLIYSIKLFFFILSLRIFYYLNLYTISISTSYSLVK